jgi:2-amino-4-hydroxy-6-hydroxymethyldihydropteridine diphosphokinase
VTAVLSLGSNLGDRLAHLGAGLEVLAQHVALDAVSPVYETAPTDLADQPAYLNLVVLAATGAPEVALTAAHAAETAQGRLRSRRWGPRTLDVDVVSVDQRVSADPRLTLPHPRAAQRAFVLRPWLDVDPAAVLPGEGTVRALLARVGVSGTRRVGRIGRP